MSSNDTKETLTEAAKESPLKLAGLALSLLSFLKELIPAFLIAWNNSLRQKNRELEVKLEHAKLRADIDHKSESIELQNAKKTSSDIVNDFLAK